MQHLTPPIPVSYTHLDVYKRQGKKWDSFPAGALAWRVSDESFMKSSEKWLDNLKLRGGDLNHLTYGGDNITTEAGTYVITLKLGDASNYHATVVKR